MLADRYTSDARFSDISRSTRSMFPLPPLALLLIGAVPLRWWTRPGRAQARSSSLMLVLARVPASTCLTITAQYRLYWPDAAGRLPETTTEPAGMRPYVTDPVARS